MMEHAAIVCTDVHKTYTTEQALQGLNLHIPKGKVTGILGPNGSGKSTLFKLIVGLTQPTSGAIRVFEQEPGWRINRQIAYLPDRAGWYPNRTVENVLEWGNALLPYFNAKKANELLQFMNLRKDMVTQGLSKGEEARLLLILTIARDVPLLLLDEPFSGIDLVSREKIIAALIDLLSNKEQTVVLTTHEIYEAEALFDYVVFIDDGRVIQQGEAEQLRAQNGSMENMYRALYR